MRIVAKLLLTLFVVTFVGLNVATYSAAMEGNRKRGEMLRRLQVSADANSDMSNDMSSSD